MHLSASQLDRFFDLLDSLLVFANGRLDLVDGLTLPIAGEEAEMKAAFVCEMLWENRELIDEFVRVNPRGMSQRDLACVAAWRDALVSDFALLRHEDGRALLMNDAGIFAVAGLDADLSQRLTQTPDILHASLLPFEGLIVTDGLEMGSGMPLNEEELRAMNELYERLAPAGVARTADELRARAADFNQQKRELEFDALLASVELEARQSREGEQLPPGYHRGVLAGLPAEEREARILAHLASLQREQEAASHGQEPDALPGQMPADAQEAVPAEDQEAVPASSVHAQEAVPAGNQEALSADALSEEQAYEQERDIVVLNCADALTQMCGLLTIKEAYEAYGEVVLDVVELERFVATLMAEDAKGTGEFVLQDWHGQSYLMHYTISDAYAREWVAQQQAQRLEQQASSLRTESDVARALAQMVDEVAHGVEAELANLEDYRKHLLEGRAHIERHPLDPRAADGGYLELLASQPALVQLRDFLDAHVPDGEDDYSYAERALEELIAHSIDSGDAMAFLDEVERAGLSACTENPALLFRLLENAYAALPSWECNGWSPQELMERLTGRSVFYNERGEMMHLSAHDRCPCGSGREYDDCHGRSAAH